MYKQIIVALSVIATVAASGVSAVSLTGPDACSSEALAYLKAFDVDPSIQVLVDEQKRFYPSFDEMLDEGLSLEFAVRMKQVGSQPGCAELTEYVDQLGDEDHVPCFSEHRDASGLFALWVKANESIKRTIEANYACLVADMKMIQTE